MEQVSDYLRVIELEHVKDYDVLEKVPGFVVVDGDSVTGAFNTGGDTAFIALLEFLPTKPRGDHCHKEKIENMTVLSGRLKCEFWLPEVPNSLKEMVLTSGQQVRILPGCAHTYTAIDTKVIALEFSPQAFRNNDVVSVEHP